MKHKYKIMAKAASILLALALIVSGIMFLPSTAQAVGWPDYAKELTLGTTVNGTIKEGDYSNVLENGFSSGEYWWHVYKFSMPKSGLLNIYLESGNSNYFYQSGSGNGFAIFSYSNPDELIWRSCYRENSIDCTYSTAREIYYGSAEIALEQGDYYFTLRQLYTSNTPYYLTLSYKEPIINVVSISLGVKSIKLDPGEQYTFNATVLPNNATDKTVIWKSSNSSVASVADGVLTANSPGNATITAMSSDGEISATCTVTVIDTETIDKLEQAKPKITKAVSGRKKATIYFSDLGISGIKYQVSYRTGNEKWRTKNVSGTSAMIKNLKSKKTYSIRVRGYKAIDGITYYSQWSSIKKVKVK